MNALLSNPLFLSIAAPFAVAVAILCGLPQRWSKRLAYLGFGLPALISVVCWATFPANNGAQYAWFVRASTGLEGFGISLALGLNGVSLPLFVLAGLVGLAAGLYAIRSTAERITSSATLRPQSTWLESHSSNGSRTMVEISLSASRLESFSLVWP